MFHFSKNYQIILTQLFHFIFPPVVYEFQFLHILASTCYFMCFLFLFWIIDILNSCGCEVPQWGPLYLWLPHLWIQPTMKFHLGLVSLWTQNPGMRNLGMEWADCTSMPFYIRDLCICEFWYLDRGTRPLLQP